MISRAEGFNPVDEVAREEKHPLEDAPIFDREAANLRVKAVKDRETTPKPVTNNETITTARKQVLNAYSNNRAANEVPNSREVAVERINQLRLSDEELISRTAKWSDVKVNQEALRIATERNGNPNVHGEGMFFGSGNLPMDDNSVYRHVGTSAIADLMNQGFVRNKREAAGALDIPGKRGFGTEGATVYWNDGDSSRYETADLVIQADKSAADKGYVTKDDIQGILVTDRNTGRPVNLIDGRDHTGLDIAPHRQ